MEVFWSVKQFFGIAFYLLQNKNIIPIDAAEVSNWGGSVHCLAMEILRANENQLGDVNGDSDINVIDVVQLVSFILGNNTPDETVIDASDLNSDGILNILDVVALVSIIMS